MSESISNPTSAVPSATPQSTPTFLQIAALCQLTNVLLRESHAATQVAPCPVDTKPEFKFDATATMPNSQGRFLVEARAQATAFTLEDEPRPAYVVSVAFVLAYSLTNRLDAADAAYQQFADTNGKLNAYPYIREYLQSSVQRMGFPPLILPVFRVPKSSAQVTAAASSTSLPEGTGSAATITKERAAM